MFILVNTMCTSQIRSSLSMCSILDNTKIQQHNTQDCQQNKEQRSLVKNSMTWRSPRFFRQVWRCRFERDKLLQKWVRPRSLFVPWRETLRTHHIGGKIRWVWRPSWSSSLTILLRLETHRAGKTLVWP